MAAWKRAGLPVERVPILTMRQVRERLDRAEPLPVTDVRQAHEWATGRIPQAETLEAGAVPTAELRLPHDRLIATHCGHGQPAATALSVLERRGYRNLAVITEGIDDWRKAGVAATPSLPSQSPVAAGAGLTMLTRMPRGPTSLDSAL
jgi:hydroxyacylglutathione hydrolase